MVYCDQGKGWHFANHVPSWAGILQTMCRLDLSDENISYSWDMKHGVHHKPLFFFLLKSNSSSLHKPPAALSSWQEGQNDSWRNNINKPKLCLESFSKAINDSLRGLEHCEIQLKPQYLKFSRIKDCVSKIEFQETFTLLLTVTVVTSACSFTNMYISILLVFVKHFCDYFFVQDSSESFWKLKNTRYFCWMLVK